MAPKRSYHTKPGKPTKVACANCNGPTLHDVLYMVSETDKDENMQWWTTDEILECRGCQGISFRQNWQNTEDIEQSDEDGSTYTLVDHETLYPSRIAGAAPMSDSHLLPVQLMRIYDETHSALSANLPVLAGIGIRAIVETLCVDRNAKGSNLEKRIEDLAKQGVITEAGAKILHSLRLMGNQAAHEVTPHKTEVLLIAMRVVEHALQGVYILPRQAERLPSSKSRKASK